MIPTFRINLEPAGPDAATTDTADAECGVFQRIHFHADPDIISGCLIIFFRVQEIIAFEPERKRIVKSIQFCKNLAQVQ